MTRPLRPRVTWNVSRIDNDAMLTWESQAVQYPVRGPAGVSYLRGDASDGTYVDCLLFRGPGGDLWGILNHYPVDSYWERAGNVNLWVRRDKRRRGIGSRLLDEARARWELRPADQQRFSDAGAAFFERYSARRPEGSGPGSPRRS